MFPFVTDPAKTLFILITDLYEGGNEAQLGPQIKSVYKRLLTFKQKTLAFQPLFF